MKYDHLIPSLFPDDNEHCPVPGVNPVLDENTQSVVNLLTGHFDAERAERADFT